MTHKSTITPATSHHLHSVTTLPSKTRTADIDAFRCVTF